MLHWSALCGEPKRLLNFWQPISAIVGQGDRAQADRLVRRQANDDDIANAKQILAELDKICPGDQGQGYEVRALIY